jgi:hypothetical protein
MVIGGIVICALILVAFSSGFVLGDIIGWDRCWHQLAESTRQREAAPRSTQKVGVSGDREEVGS